MKIVLCGPPHSGKSCLRYGLKEAIKAIPGAPYPYVITACPDGEGAWYQESIGANDALTDELKKAYKGKFTDEYANRVAEDVKNCALPLVLLDIGGKIDQKNKDICATATHAILLAGDLAKLSEWRDFCAELKLQIIAEIHSDYEASSDRTMTLGNDGIYRGAVRHLERGDTTIPQRPTVTVLASILVKMTNTKENSMATYQIKLEGDDLLRISFGAPAQMDTIVKDAKICLDDLIAQEKIRGGQLMRINGPASLQVAMMLAHGLGHLYQAVACYDPKLHKYIVVIAHGNLYALGDLID